MAQLYCNENFPLPVVLELRRLGNKCVTVAESGGDNVRMTDAEVLTYAAANSMAVITLNRRHFIALHEQRPNHAGIIVCTVDNDFAALARRIDETIKLYKDGLSGRLIRVTRGG